MTPGIRITTCAVAGLVAGIWALLVTTPIAPATTDPAQPATPQVTLRQTSADGTIRSCGRRVPVACRERIGSSTWWRVSASPPATYAGTVATVRLYRLGRSGAWAHQLTRRAVIDAEGRARLQVRAPQLRPGRWAAQVTVTARTRVTIASSSRRFLQVRPGPVTELTYSIGSLGFDPGRSRMAEFRDVVASTLDDPRGWALEGRVRFREVERGSWRVLLSSPSAVGGFGGCSSAWSCRSGSYVLINDDRWTGATATYPGAALLHPYRTMVINHESGHALGFGHRNCRRRAAPAPVMQQQSKFLLGCSRNPRPLSSERTTLARRLGVRIPAPQPLLVPGITAGRVELGMTVREVRARAGKPQRSIRHGRRFRVDVHAVPRLRVTYRDGRVAGVLTRAAGECTVERVCVGGPARLVRRLSDATCTVTSGDGSCVVGSGDQVGGRTPTTFTIRRGRVAAVLLRWLPAPDDRSRRMQPTTLHAVDGPVDRVLALPLAPLTPGSE